MNFLSRYLHTWRSDRLLGRVVKNSTYLLVSNAISAVLSIVTANLLGVATFGVLGIITSFVANINRLLSFRMGDMVVKYMGEALEHKDIQRAAAVVKVAVLAEAVTSALTYGVLVLLAPLGAQYFAKDPTVAPLFVLYGISILGNITTETATGVLQVGNQFRSQALVNLFQSVLVAVLLIGAALTHAGLLAVLGAYLVGKMILGLGPIVLAARWLPQALGKDWWRAPLTHLPPWRELAGFAISTNFSGTINVFARDSESLWVGFFFGPVVAGYFKVALALISLAVTPINPFISTTYPEITRAIANRQWPALRRLLRRVSLIALGWTGAVAAGLLLVGQPLLFSRWTIFGHTFHIYSPDYLPAYPVLLVLLVGFGFANVLFWNRPLVLAQGRAHLPLRASFWCMLVKVALALVLLPRAGYLTEAALLTGYFLVSVGWITFSGLRGVMKAQAAERIQEVVV
jgi:O-antigen/teichoic acid export membrane protein